MRLAVVQNNPRFGEVEANLNAVESLLRGPKADVYVLPELFASGYLFRDRAEVEALAEPVEDGPTLRRLRIWAAELNAAICAGWPERSGDALYNSAVLVGPQGVLTHYRKLQLFDREKLHFAPGDRPLAVVEFRGARLGVMICFDWRFPEVTRTLALAGADVILHPSNLVQPYCPDAMITRSLENKVFTATCDRWGVDDRGSGLKVRYIGSSQVVDPRGTRLGRLGEAEDGVLRVEIDPAAARDKQATAHNDLFGDRRTEWYRLGPTAS
jgi:predicted amidohydrolase